MARCKVGIIREPGVGEDAKTVDVILGERNVFDLAVDELKSVFWDDLEARIEIRQGHMSLLETRVTLAADHQVKFALQAVARGGLLGRFRGAEVCLVELERAPLPPVQPTLKKSITQQMWMGRADGVHALNRMLEEREAYFSEGNEEAEGTPDYVGFSEFADLMGDAYYDHDFVEYGFAKPGDALETKFQGHSWVNNWAPVVRETVPEEIWRDANAFLMIGFDTVSGTPRAQIPSPVDVVTDGVVMTYVGEITHPV